MKLFLVILSAIIIFVLVNIAIFEYKDFNKTTKETLDIVSDTLNQNIEQASSNSLSLAIILSSNESLKDALKNGDDERGFNILDSIANQLNKHTLNKDIKIQVITKDLYIFARSWDSVFSGMPIEDFRQDLLYKKSQPHVSIEVGRMLSIIATVPIYDNGDLIGYLEVVRLFENFVDRFRKLGIELFVLMNYEYLDSAIFMMDNDVLDNYVIAHHNYNKFAFNKLKSIDFKELEANKSLISNNYIISFQTIKNSNNREIGAFLLAIDRNKINNIFNQELLFFINLTSKNILDITSILNSEILNKSLQDISTEDLIRLYQIDENKKVYKELISRLDSKSKRDLIELILKIDTAKVIKGEIR